MILVAGTHLGRYKIRSRIGAGGMGEVYLAQDTQLGRKVAIKVLTKDSTADAQARRRLIHEAQAAAKLDHPNICSIHEVAQDNGHSFIVMQYVEGETLAARIQRKPIELRESLDIAMQVADALAEAHSRGIVHRDIKPQNMMITARRQVKVLDFGLAKMAPDGVSADSEAETQSLLTEPGTIVGTVPYMSPEQVRGETLDARSDIFSLGAVLYEMVSGRRPFGAESAAGTISAILTREPPPLARYADDVPPELQRILHKSLEKDREGRYQSARDLFIDLKNLRRDIDLGGSGIVTTEKVTTEPRSNIRPLTFAALTSAAVALIALGLYFLVFGPTAIDSIAIMPLANVSPDSNAEYLSDGITENIINTLSQLPRLRVMARTTVFRYKGREVDPQTIGRDLGVRAVVTGRVFRVGDILNIQTELVDATNGSQLWGEKYNRKIGDIFTVQEEIARVISEKLRLRLGDEDKKHLERRYTNDTKAYELYLRGRYYLKNWTEDGFRKGVEYLNQAIEADPQYALAYAGLADAYTLSPFLLSSPREASQEARKAANKALEIDETLAEAHTSLAIIKMYLDWDWSGAESELKRAIELNPGDASARNWYGWYLGLMGRFDESMAELRQAERLDPLSLTINGAIGENLYLSHQYGRAIDQYKNALELEPNFAITRLFLAQAYEQQGRLQEALAECQKVSLLNQSPDTLAVLGHAYAVSGKTDEALKILNELKEQSTQRFIPSYLIATIYAGLGDKNGAFEWFEKAYAERSGWMAFFKTDPELESLHSDARFTDLLGRVGLAQ